MYGDGDFIMGKKRYYSTAVNKAVQKYSEKAYDRLSIRVKKGDGEKIKKYAKSKGMTLNGYVNDLIYKDMN